MKTSNRPQLVPSASSDYEEAAKALCRAAAQDYPVGSTVSYVPHGATKPIEAEVTGVNDMWWSDPGGLRVRNLKTGKYRRVSCTHESLELISL